jgi:O-antigen ligase
VIEVRRNRRAPAAAVAATAALLSGAVVAVIGTSATAAVLGAIGIVAVAAIMVVHAPAATLALLVVAGPLKQTPLADAIPVDLTLSALAVVMVAAVRVAWSRRAQPFAPGAPPALMLLLAAWMIASLLWSPAGLAATGKVWEFAAVSATAFVAAMWLGLSATVARDLAAGLAIAATAVAWFAVETGHPARPIALPGSNSEIDLGFITALGVVAIVAYLIPRTGGWWKAAWAIPLAIIVPKLVGAGSRGALLAASVGLLAVVAAHAAGWRARRPAAAGALVAMVAALAAAWVMSPDAARERYAQGLAGLGSGSGGVLATAGGRRPEFLEGAIAMFASSPWGVGVGGYTALTGWKWPHNILGETGAELGVVGLALLVALIAVVLARVLKAMRRAPDDALVLTIGLMVVPLVLSMSSFDLNGNRILWIMLGVGAGIAATRAVNRTAP